LSRQFSRRDFLKYTEADLPAFFYQISFRNSSGRPSFIIFLADDLGYGDLACYGHPIIKSPHLNHFAEEGRRFTDCQSGGTVSSVSRASLLPGRNPYRVGFYRLTGGGAHL